MHIQRERVWASPRVRWLSHLYRSVLLGLCLPSGQILAFFFPHLTYPGTFPGVHSHVPISQDRSKLRLLGGARLIMVWVYPLTFYSQGALLSMCRVSPLSPRYSAWQCLLTGWLIALYSIILQATNHSPAVTKAASPAPERTFLTENTVNTCILQGMEKKEQCERAINQRQHAFIAHCKAFSWSFSLRCLLPVKQFLG